eukprot:SAG31_NODE_22435_length_525_cov_1.340376_1_plen_142_part_00
MSKTDVNLTGGRTGRLGPSAVRFRFLAAGPAAAAASRSSCTKQFSSLSSLNSVPAAPQDSAKAHPTTAKSSRHRAYRMNRMMYARSKIPACLHSRWRCSELLSQKSLTVACSRPSDRSCSCTNRSTVATASSTQPQRNTVS